MFAAWRKTTNYPNLNRECSYTFIYIYISIYVSNSYITCSELFSPIIGSVDTIPVLPFQCIYQHGLRMSGTLFPRGSLGICPCFVLTLKGHSNTQYWCQSVTIHYPIRYLGSNQSPKVTKLNQRPPDTFNDFKSASR